MYFAEAYFITLGKCSFLYVREVFINSSSRKLTDKGNLEIVTAW